MNIAYSSGSRQYALNIPKYMVNRPGPLVDDMLEKRKKVTPFMLSSVHPICVLQNEKAFWVESVSPTSNEHQTYIVYFGDDNKICSCDCFSFRHQRVLCKHFMAIFETGKGSFHEISTKYLHHPYTNIDEFVTVIIVKKKYRN